MVTMLILVRSEIFPDLEAFVDNYAIIPLRDHSMILLRIPVDRVVYGGQFVVLGGYADGLASDRWQGRLHVHLRFLPLSLCAFAFGLYRAGQGMALCETPLSFMPGVDVEWQWIPKLQSWGRAF